MRPMRHRSYAICMLAAAFTVFGTVTGANLLIDPEGVLGTGMLGPLRNPNDRYSIIARYQANASRYDGLIFGSSRGPAIEADELSRRMHAHFAQLSVSAGQMIDHVAFLEYAIRSRRTDDPPIRAVFLLLDIDAFGNWATANRFIQTLWPPAITGEPRWRFIWRHLTAIQPTIWQSEIAHALARRASVAPAREPPVPEAGRRSRTGPPSPMLRLASLQSLPLASDRPAWPQALAQSPAPPQPAAPRAPSAMPPPRAADEGSATIPDLPNFQQVAAGTERITRRKHFAEDLTLLRRFVALCRATGIELVVALSPLHVTNAARFDRADLEDAIERVVEIVPVWDFGAPAWLSQRRELWRDYGHFREEVGRMMLDRIFATADAAAPADFGVYRSSAAAPR
jgi:hypothetical protein